MSARVVFGVGFGGALGEIERRIIQNRAAPVRNVAQMAGQLAERHRFFVRLPRELVVWNPLEQLPRRAHFVIVFSQQPVFERHAT